MLEITVKVNSFAEAVSEAARLDLELAKITKFYINSNLYRYGDISDIAAKWLQLNNNMTLKSFNDGNDIWETSVNLKTLKYYGRNGIEMNIQQALEKDYITESDITKITDEFLERQQKKSLAKALFAKWQS